MQNNATRNVANHSAMLALPLLDQPLIVGPDFLPVPAKLVAQIVAGKYINLSALLVVNLMQRGPESQLLFDGRPSFPSSWSLTFRTAGKISCSTSC